MITPTAGTAPFYYSTDGGLTYPALDTIRNLASGSYNIKVKDAVGCIYDSPPVTVNNNIGVTATFTTINSACSAASTGQIIINPTTGIAPFYYSIDGGVTYPALDTIRNLAGGVYNIKVKDAVGCIYDAPPVTVSSNNPGVGATFATVNSACTGVSTGQIIITPTIGIAPFSYSTDGGLTFPALDTIRNLAGGVYNIKVRDGLGCTYDAPPVTVSNNIGVTATFTTINSACSGISTGQIVITPTAGTAPFYYSTDGGLTYPALDTIRNLASGSYNIKVKDAVGCVYDSPPVTVNNNIGVTATFTTINSACSAASTGQIIINPTTGIAPFYYSIDGGVTYPALDTIRNLAGGVYNIKVKDAVGCIFDAPPVTVSSNNPGVGATFATVNSACTGVSTGQIIITPTIGIAPFSYSTDGGLTFPALDTIRNLAGGVYNIKVRDGLGCTYDAPPVTVSNNIGVTATFTTINSACAVASTGQIIIRPTTGIAPFSYSIDGGVTYPVLDTIRNLAGGIYNIKVKDAVGCIYDSPAVTVNSNNPGVGAIFATVNASCSGVSNGKIIITPTIGIAPFSYSADGGITFPALDTIRNLAGGSYNIKVRDGLGCTYDAPPVTVNNNIGVTANYTLVKAACTGSATGAIIVKPATGTPVFRYSLDGGVTYQYDSVFRKLAANPYTITIKDTAGCILNSPVQNLGNNPGVLTSASIIKNASCASVPNGSIVVNVSAGIAPFTYTLSSVPGAQPQPGNSFGSLFSGSYDVTIVDSAGCTKTITSVVGNDPKIKIDSLSIVRPTCNSLLNGTITVNASLGVMPYQFAMDAGSYSVSKGFTGVGAGPHTIHVRDANSCQIDSAITITEPAVLTNSLVATTPSTCSGNPDGQIVVTAAGGTLPYTYTLDVAGLTGYQALSSFAVIAGSYKVTAADAKGCKANVNVVVDSVFTMFLDLGRDTTICAEQSVVLTPLTNGGTTIFTYSPSSSLDKADIKNPKATPADTTKYKLTAQWGICTLSDSILVNVLRKPKPDAGADVVICYDTTVVLRASASNLSGTVNYLWSQASLLDGKADTTVVTARPKDLKTYYVVTVTDNYGCNFSVSDSVLVNMLPPVYAFAGNDTNAVLNAPHQLTASGAGVGGTYQWSFPAGVTLSNDQIGNPTAIFQPVAQPGTFHPDTNYYQLSVIAINQAGCRATDTVKVNVFVGPPIMCRMHLHLMEMASMIFSDQYWLE
ncbi:MAG: hypothetical protein IPP72_21885 [Chitinophagaceae bacterium]|nr:hypothetical protein [Chitinophagaceae bacterium]